MAYVLGQYSKAIGDDSSFMSLITNGTIRRKAVQLDSGASSGGLVFNNECIQINGSFNNNNSYYFHGKIKRMRSNQVFTIKLVNYSSDDLEQYIKKITIGGGDVHDWVDIEFIFNPYATFDTILFELQRTSEDYIDETRYPIIIYEEISLINNLISRRIGANIKLLKIGVQSKPGFLMCINGEEIRTSRSGIYELRDNIILIKFFSAVAAAKENSTVIEDAIYEINALWDAADALSTPAQRAQEKSLINSRQFLNSSKTREINDFILDYLYEED